MSFHSIHNVVDCGVLQEMWEELAITVGHTVINSLSANHVYLKTLCDDLTAVKEAPYVLTVCIYNNEKNDSLTMSVDTTAVYSNNQAGICR